MLHTSDGPYHMENNKYMKKMIAIMFFMWQSPSKVCNMGTPWMRNKIFHPMSTPTQNLSKTLGEIS